MKVLFASDGSACSERAAAYLAKSLRTKVQALEVTLFHVDEPMLERVAAALGAARVAQIHRENSHEALKRTRQRLRRAGVAFTEEHGVGKPADGIAEKAARGKFDLVLMGSHGRGALRNALLGSVTARVLAACAVPVLVVH